MSTGKIIDGKEIARQLRLQLHEEAQSLISEHGVTPGLAVVLVGNNPASHLYVRMKKQACVEVGITSYSHELPEETSEEALLSLIQTLNEHPAVHGILVQMPLPAHIRSQRILEAISPDKDADGFHPRNVGLLAVGAPLFRPCTPWGCMELLHSIGVKPAGQSAVVLGRSNIVGKPVALMLLAENATVTLCHSQTKQLPEMVRQADILISAMGQPELIRGDWLKPGAVVIDVGMNRRASDGKLCGDVAFQEALPKVAAITPVPGGVGPMTITMLMKNTLFSASRCVA
ncbi:bifunctional methylenetetrahydrofolate dehydrogenase/methenyltetrahydrofolate cyclohydrolase FolD [Candidatus Magnetaquicoccus inordinatus]|uniref:bifunctional methylenetetrahydrofolate dehydrogenase/methenyltetrahydrofolate cyclohydrolase FolD n=1 Tax=Candidatus Magnetaquicoccus inordinatus TaxID=2496818 RepID=UPI00102B200F|nr:bifunctional methylenetetrahydrofolate dehydrogenase/methenyltetrahydrofolate cyclohydrolase FolD [Candidatus Magnetaquicoccus inordinatus]